MRTILGLPERFWSKAMVQDTGYDTPCLTWCASTTHEGYAKFHLRGRVCLAHRVTYEAQFGPIQDGLELDHLCRNTSCVNVDHLERVTHAENMRRAKFTDHPNALKTHCEQGHPYNAANTIPRSQGKRRCRTCHNAQQARRYQRVRQQAAAGTAAT